MVLFRPGQCEVEQGFVGLLGPVVVQESKAAFEHLGLLLQEALKLSPLLLQTPSKLILLHFNLSVIHNLLSIFLIVSSITERQICKIDRIGKEIFVSAKHLQGARAS